MMSNISIKSKLLLLSLLTIIIVSVSIAVDSIYSLNRYSSQNIEKYKSEAYAKKEKELKNYISLAMKTVETYHNRTSPEKIKIEVQAHLKEQTNFLLSILESEYAKLNGTLEEDELKERLKSIVSATRYGDSGYFWVNDTNAVIVIHPIKPALNGKDMVDYQDKGGKKIFKEFADVAKANGEGFVDYIWPKPGFDKPQPKVSFVKLFKPYNWVIGTGEYVSDVTSKIQEEAKKTISEMRYGKDGYFWINNSFPKMVMHPIKPSLNGKDLSANTDAKGKKHFVEMSKVANASKDGGLISYWWDRPEKKGDPREKFSYVQKFEPWDWIIGTGAYVDDIENDVALMNEKTNKEINNIIFNISIFSLIAVILVYLLYTYFIKKMIINPLNNLNNAIINIKDNDSSSDTIEKHSNDEIGLLVDSFNAYIAKLKTGYEEDAKVIEEVDSIITKVINGFYVYKIEKTSSNNLIVKLRDSINTMIDKTNENLVSLNNLLLEYGNSNFETRVLNESDSNVNGIISSLNASARLVGVTVSEFLSMLVSSGKKLNEDTNILSSSATRLSDSANEQAASLEETAAAVEEITSIVKSSVQNVYQMSILANELHDSSREGEDLASKTTRAMDDIDDQVRSINEAITVIDQIAFQTNILSLNAAVEAATAGEAGKGFAVVAQEVRNLASRSAEAAKEIKSIVESATSKANEGKVIANNMIGGYTTLNSKINETITLIENVSQASKEEEKGIVQINDAINALDQATQVNANSATTISELAEEVSMLSANLLQIADRAKFNESSKEEIQDINLVFNIAKLKNDHIKFKNINFAKLGTSNIPWTVTKPNECDLGKWLIEQEHSNKSFTKTSNWKLLKEKHEIVHNSVQLYINEDCNVNSDENLLNNLSIELDKATNDVFICLDQIKKDNKIEQKAEVVVKKEIKKPSAPIPSKKIVSSSKTTVGKVAVAPKQNIQVKSTTKDEDDWESF